MKRTEYLLDVLQSWYTLDTDIQLNERSAMSLRHLSERCRYCLERCPYPPEGRQPPAVSKMSAEQAVHRPVCRQLTRRQSELSYRQQHWYWQEVHQLLE